jgi:hypothetical protein
MSIDSDLLLYRETEIGLTNLIIHPDDDFAISYIGKKEGDTLEFYELHTADFEKIIFTFLSK